MKLKCIKNIGLRLQPSGRVIKLGDIIEDESLVNLLKDHPAFESVKERKKKEEPKGETE